jgi:hypothetical protein
VRNSSDEKLPVAWTGAATGTAGLALASVRAEDGWFELDASRSALFVLEDDQDQASLKQVFEEVAQFTIDRGIRELVLRVSFRGGTYATSRKARRLEAALELLPGVVVHWVNSQSLGPWSERLAHELPELPPEVSGPERFILTSAMHAARLAHALGSESVEIVDGCVR